MVHPLFYSAGLRTPYVGSSAGFITKTRLAKLLDGLTEFESRGRPITLAEGTVVEACLGALAASTVLQKLLCLEKTGLRLV